MFVMKNIVLEDGSKLDDIELESDNLEDAEEEAMDLADEEVDSDDIPDWDSDEHAWLRVKSYSVEEES